MTPNRSPRVSFHRAFLLVGRSDRRSRSGASRSISSFLLALLALLALVLPVGLAAAPPVAPVIAFEETAVVATGFDPGAPVLLVSVSREPGGFLTRVNRHIVPLVADDVGTARHEIPDGVPPASVWGVFDLASGAFDAVSGPGEIARELPFPPGALRPGATGKIDRLGELAQGLDSLDALLIRPAGNAPEAFGVWNVYLMDGSGLDLDGTDDGLLEVALERFRPLDPSLLPTAAAGFAGIVPSVEPPEGIVPGDVLLLVDPDGLSFAVARFAR